MSSEATDVETTATSLINEEGRRIRWERAEGDSGVLVILDAVTGSVIAVVQSLFEIMFH